MGCASSGGAGSGHYVRPTLSQLQKMNIVGADELGAQKVGLRRSTQAKDGKMRSGQSCLDILVKNTVLVAVRVRPRNKKEGAEECIKQEHITSLLVRREGDSKDVRFAFDCLLEQQATQEDVFLRTGMPLMFKVLEGYNGCLFAYGQTGSGKTYTMQGEKSGVHRGVIPQMCEELFSEVQERKMSKHFLVVVSMLEIYNDRIKDLLQDGDDDLGVREDTTGPMIAMSVEGLSEHEVKSSADIMKLIQSGQAKRAVGQTNMNVHSSRSHAVVTLKIASWDVGDEDKVTLTVSKLHLIDLAGSERAKATGATGGRLKEGAQINLSLSVLGNVINALTEGKGTRHIPYRDSKLTRLLQDSLGGNAYTVMLCNISPAKVNVDETLSSLRFAERAKKIENKATVCRDPKNEKMLKLMEHNKALVAKCKRLEAHVYRLEQHYDWSAGPME